MALTLCPPDQQEEAAHPRHYDMVHINATFSQDDDEGMEGSSNLEAARQRRFQIMESSRTTVRLAFQDLSNTPQSCWPRPMPVIADTR
jgi:hypothetical protein